MRLVVVGADGRMGRMLIRAVAEAEGCTLPAAIEREADHAADDHAREHDIELEQLPSHLHHLTDPAVRREDLGGDQDDPGARERNA